MDGASAQPGEIVYCPAGASAITLTLLRAATKYHHQPIAMYDITSFGRAPLEVKLKALSEGAALASQRLWSKAA